MSQKRNGSLFRNVSIQHFNPSVKEPLTRRDLLFNLVTTSMTSSQRLDSIKPSQRLHCLSVCRPISFEFYCLVSDKFRWLVLRKSQTNPVCTIPEMADKQFVNILVANLKTINGPIVRHFRPSSWLVDFGFDGTVTRHNVANSIPLNVFANEFPAVTEKRFTSFLLPPSGQSISLLPVYKVTRPRV